MRDFEIFIWAIIGFLTAFVVFKSQQWSVNILNPNKRALSFTTILVGAFLRWVFVAIILIIAALQSSMAMLIFFVTLMVTRSFILFFLGKVPKNNKRLLNRF